MRTINEYKNRFNQLLEATIGNVKPLIMEQGKTLVKLLKGKELTGFKKDSILPEGNGINFLSDDNEIIIKMRMYPKKGYISTIMMTSSSGHSKTVKALYDSLVNVGDFKDVDGKYDDLYGFKYNDEGDGLVGTDKGLGVYAIINNSTNEINKIFDTLATTYNNNRPTTQN